MVRVPAPPMVPGLTVPPLLTLAVTVPLPSRVPPLCTVRPLESVNVLPVPTVGAPASLKLEAGAVKVARFGR